MSSTLGPTRNPAAAPGREAIVPGAAPGPADAGDTDVLARRLAYLTVGVPALGFVAAVAWSVATGFRWLDGGLLAGMYLFTALGVEGGLHRFFSHHAFRGRPAVTTFFGVAGSMAAQGPVLFWAATHRIHHVHTDQDGDPHSPRPRGDDRWASVRGLWHGHAGWLFSVRRDSWAGYVPDLLRDRTVMAVNRHYFTWVALGLALPTAVGGVVGGWQGAVGGLLWGGLARIFLLDQVTWAVNSIGHTLGTRPHATRDNSRNVAPLAPFSVGGGWHNNHHAQPALATTRKAPWQVDVAGRFIWLLDRCGLVTDVRYEDTRHGMGGS